MALDPNIALGVRPMELANPLAQYGQIAQIQSAQNQNALAQYQLGAAQREQESTNALNRAYAEAYNPTTGAIDANKLRQSLSTSGFGSKLPAVEKGLLELNKIKTETQKAEGDLVGQRLDLSKRRLDTVRTPEEYLSWHNANHKDPVLRSYFDSLGITAESANADIMQKLSQPGGFEQLLRGSALGLEKSMEQHFAPQNTGTTTRTLAMPKYALPGAPSKATVVSGSEAATQMSRYEQARIGQENQRLAQEATGVVYQEDANGNVIALPSRLKKGEVPTARIAVAPGGGFQPLQGKPSEAVGKEQMSINQQRAIVKGAIDAATTTPDAFGMSRGLMGETLGGRMGSSQENQARSYLFNVVSGVIKERAGTAQSAAEAETLARFLPQPTDNADTIVDKMTAFDKYLVAKETGTTKKRGGADKPPLAPMDQEALKWANSNPADPRAAAIKQRLGM